MGCQLTDVTDANNESLDECVLYIRLSLEYMKP
jgi:hypothetical protein